MECFSICLLLFCFIVQINVTILPYLWKCLCLCCRQKNSSYQSKIKGCIFSLACCQTNFDLDLRKKSGVFLTILLLWCCFLVQSRTKILTYLQKQPYCQTKLFGFIWIKANNPGDVSQFDYSCVI